MGRSTLIREGGINATRNTQRSTLKVEIEAKTKCVDAFCDIIRKGKFAYDHPSQP